MPATIACPKCQTRYKLPDSALGKPIKCQKCGASFRTQRPTGQPQAPVQAGSSAAAPQPSQQEMAKYGIEGPMKRQADIFSAPPPQHGGSLGNFALEDPGFADVEMARQEVREEEGSPDGMQSIIANPYAASKTKGGKGKKSNQPDVDLSGYAVARVGMWMVFVSWSTLLAMMVLIYAFGWIANLAPEFVRKMVETIGPGFFMGLSFTILGLMFLSLGVVFIGQIICIFSPNNDEKLFAGLAVGSLVAAVILPVVGILIGAIGAGVTSGSEGTAGDAASAAIGFMMLFILLSAYLLALGNMFFFIIYFRRVGRNIRSKQVVESAKLAMIAWITALVVGVICGITVSILLAVFKDQPTWITTMANVVQLVNVVLGFTVMGTLIGMAKTTLEKTKPA